MPVLLGTLAAVSAIAVEIPVTQPVYGPAPGNQYYAAAASNGDQYFVVWVDERAEVRESFATRIAADGTLLDPNGLRVASGALTYYPSVIWGGSAWFVFANDCAGIQLVRVDADGVALDAKPRIFAIDNAWCPGTSAASDGRYVAISYVTGDRQYEQHVLIIDSDGEKVADLILSGPGDFDDVPPALAWDGTSFVAVWKNRAVRFDRNGPLGSPREVAIEGSADHGLHMATDGKSFLITRGGLAFWMSGDLVSQFRLQLPFSSVQSLFWTGTNYVITGVVPFVENGHENRERIDILLLDRDGRLVAQREMQPSGSGAYNPPNGAAVASNGRNLLVAWNDASEARVVPYAEDDMYASFLSLPDLTAAPRRLLSVAAGTQLAPVTAAGAENFLTVWQEATGVYARRHWRGGRTDAAPLRVSGYVTSAAVAFDGSSFVVGTTEGSAVVMRRVPATGELRVDGESRLEGSHPQSIALANDGAATLVAWLDGGVNAARADALSGRIEVAPAPLAATTHRISIASDGAGTFLVVWGGSSPACLICSPSTPATSGPVRAARVTPALTLLDRPPITIESPIDILDARGDPSSRFYDPQHSVAADHPSVAWNGSEWLVVWNRAYRVSSKDLSTKEEIRGRRLQRDGTLIEGTAADPGILIVQDAFAPTVAWTGSAYLLGWYDGVPTYRGYSFTRALQRLHAASLERLGAAVSGERTIGESPESDLICITVANGAAALAYARLGDQRFGGVPRAFVDLPPAVRRRAAPK